MLKMPKTLSLNAETLRALKTGHPTHPFPVPTDPPGCYCPRQVVMPLR